MPSDTANRSASGGVLGSVVGNSRLHRGLPCNPSLLIPFLASIGFRFSDSGDVTSGFSMWRARREPSGL